jgi:hypothetical protein
MSCVLVKLVVSLSHVASLAQEVTRRVNVRGIWQVFGHLTATLLLSALLSVDLHTHILQAVYTAGVVLPKPVSRYGSSCSCVLHPYPPVPWLLSTVTLMVWSSCRYYHRSLNPKKLIEVGFSRLAPRMTMNRTVRLYKLPDVRVLRVCGAVCAQQAHIRL